MEACSIRRDPIALAERQILFNATGIMLAIVIPTILATLGVAFWFRASNERARYRPDFIYSGRIEMLVWSIPLMTVLLVGTVAWIGAYDLDPPKPIASSDEASQGSGRLARLEMAVHLSRAGHRERQSSDDSGRHAGQLRTDFLGRHEQLLRAAARRPDLHHGRNGDAPATCGPTIPGRIAGCRRITAARASPICTSTSTRWRPTALRNG